MVTLKIGDIVDYGDTRKNALRGEVIAIDGNDVRVLDIGKPAGSRMLFWIPANGCRVVFSKHTESIAGGDHCASND